MGVDHVASSMRRAAAPVLNRIRQDRERAPGRLKPLLAHLGHHLFESNLNVERLRRACQIRDRSVTTHFGEVFGDTLKFYIENCRLETAARLLRDSSLKVSQIGQLVGYSALSVFSRAFDRWAGQRPRQYRQEYRSARLPEPQGDDLLSARFWRRAALGKLTGPRAEELLRFLRRLYPDQATALTDSAEHERLMADQLWQGLRQLPLDQQRACVRLQVGFRTTALFELLLAKSKTEGRACPERGVEIAELARDSLQGYGTAPTGTELANDLPNRQAQAWAWLGRARRMAMDLEGAEAALLRAESIWSTVEDRPDDSVKAEIQLFTAILRTAQYRYEEALQLADLAMPVFVANQDWTAALQTRLQRAYVSCFAGSAGAAVEDLLGALEELRQRPDDYLELTARSLLASAYVLAGRFDNAFATLEALKDPVSAIGHPSASFRLRWVEGLALLGQGKLARAEAALEGARQGLSEAGAIGQTDAAGVSLDLAILYHDLGASHRAIPLLNAALETFQACRLNNEAITSLMLLREAISAGKPGLTDLLRLREALQAVLLLPPTLRRKSP